MSAKVMIVGSAESIHTLRWQSRLQTNNYEVILYDTNEIKKSKLVCVFFFLPESLKFLLEFRIHKRRIRRILRKNEVQIIHTHWLLSSAAFAASRIRNCAKIITPWGSDVLFQKVNKLNKVQIQFHNRLMRSLVDSSDYIVADANHLIEATKRFSKRNQIKSALIYFGTDIGIFKPAPNLKVQKTENTIQIFSNRSLHEIYDIGCLIRAISILKDRGINNLSVYISSDGPLRSSLESLTTELGLNQIITFTGRIDDDKMVSLLQSSDIYVSTSLSDGGLAASVAEAMACQLPVVITNFGENTHWVVNEESGMIYESANERDLGDKIQFLIDNPDIRVKIGEKAREVIATRNNAEIETRKVIALYDEILEKL